MTSTRSADRILEHDLFLTEPDKYGDKYSDHLLEQYKIYAAMADRISERRVTANSFFLSANAIIATLMGLFLTNEGAGYAAVEIISILAASGLILCYVWRRLIQSYKDLNSAKFQIINLIEEKLPVAGFAAEWNYLESGGRYGRHTRLSVVEGRIPFLFMLIYGLLLIYTVAPIVQLLLLP